MARVLWQPTVHEGERIVVRYRRWTNRLENPCNSGTRDAVYVITISEVGSLLAYNASP